MLRYYFLGFPKCCHDLHHNLAHGEVVTWSEDMDLELLRENLSKFGQEHLLKFWDVLSEVEQKHLYDDLTAINYAEVNRFFTKCTSHSGDEKVDHLLEPVPADVFGSILKSNLDLLKTYEKEGKSNVFVVSLYY